MVKRRSRSTLLRMRHTWLGVVVMAATFAALGPVLTAEQGVTGEPDRLDLVQVVVAVEVGSNAADRVAASIEAAGGTVVSRLDTIGTLVASVPERRVSALGQLRDVVSIVPNGAVGLASDTEMIDAATQGNSAAAVTHAAQFWSRGITGSGVDVALIDSGTAPIPSLAGRVLTGPDFSSESLLPNLTSLDGFGHGTHLASIIAGVDPTSTSSGVAPGARIVSVKVADHDGNTDMVRIMSAIDWVIRNRNAKGTNIRVLALAFGVDVGDDTEPLALAVEAAWRAGLVVVVAAGNAGPTSGRLTSPATNPFVISVGALDQGVLSDPTDDRVASFSNAGDGTRNPDVLAPGVGIVGARVANSALDSAFPTARVGEDGFRGSGTSQAAAVTAGAAALLLEANPKLDPDGVKYLLRQGAIPLDGVADLLQGAGELAIDPSQPVKSPGAISTQRWKRAIKGDIFRAYRTAQETLKHGDGPQSEEVGRYEPAMTGNRWSGNRWSGNRWSGNRWSGEGWR